MHLDELVEKHARAAAHRVPEWMMGLYRRHIIAFADGTSDTETQVYWLQSRNFSIDLRLPREAGLVAQARPLADYSRDELAVLCEYEGWVAQCVWDGEQLAWREPTAFQLHDRWPEPAPLRRVGNCMIEFAPSGAYVEDWRLQPSAPGPLVGLRLIDERELESGRVLHRGGGLIVSGDYAGLVMGRAEAPGVSAPLRDHVLSAQGNDEALGRLMDFETSIARGSMREGFEVTHSTCPGRVGQQAFPLDGFTLESDGSVSQVVHGDGLVTRRRFTVDTLEPLHAWPQSTPQTPAGFEWRGKESATLGRYTFTLS
ncbi:hypothetical protein [Variovorax sp. OV329]|uniref:hypothetical protein n=1 Tax=Variovorax sp. OV329 TaxID=1882825 RepID=UPI0008F10BD3|nr:hypothetical protein [Variovorax sp. OV329]SFM97730.1 hypothetical protein SAMN05444747_11268 [Variovorax sp. OV329]